MIDFNQYFTNSEEYNFFRNKLSNNVSEFSRRLFPENLRILSNMKCHTNCPGNIKHQGWCHSEGQVEKSSSLYYPSEKIIDKIHRNFPFNTAKIIGVESIHIQETINLIKFLKNIGISDIGITNCIESYNPEIIKTFKFAGLSRLTLSAHKFDLKYKQKLDTAYDQTISMKLDDFKINRVLLKSNFSDLDNLIRWIKGKKITLRLFTLIKTRQNTKIVENEAIPWIGVSHLFLDEIKKVEIVDYSISCRLNFLFYLDNETKIETNMSYLPSYNSVKLINECRSCDQINNCEEGFFGCGIRLGGDNKIYPCILKPELSFEV